MALKEEELKKVKHRKPRKLPKVLSREEVEKLFASLNVKAPTSLRNYVGLLLAYRCGLRVSEITNLSVSDIDLENAQIYVQMGKNSKDRYVGMDEETMSWIRRWLVIKPEGDYFFCTLKGKGFNNGETYLRQVCKRMSERTGIYINDNHVKKSVHPHVFRHCYATELVEEGFSLPEVQALLGHSSIQTTSIYTHIRPEKLAAKIRERRKA